MEFLEILSFLLIRILLPLAAIVALVYLSLLFVQTINTLKRTNEVMGKAEDLVEEIEKRVEMLDGPIEAITNIYETYLKISGTITTALASFTLFNRKRK